MTIQEYYERAAMLQMNHSIAAAGMLSITLAIGISFFRNLPLSVIIVPYLFLFFVFYSQHLIYRSWSRSCESPAELYPEDFFSTTNLLIVFAPAPAIRLLFFAPDGMLAGELREKQTGVWRWLLPDFVDKRIPKRFGVYNRQGILLAQLVDNGRSMKLLNEKREVIGFYYPKSLLTGSAVLAKGSKLSIRASDGNEMLFTNNRGVTACRIQKGWMPLEWTRFFKDARTPVVTFNYSASISEKVAVFAAIANRYQYFNH